MAPRPLRLLSCFAALLLLAATAAAQERPSLQDLQEQVDAIGNRQTVLAFSPVDTTSFKTVTAECPAGKQALGGGGRITFAPGSGSVGQAIVNSYPSSDSTWLVSARSPVAPQGGWQLITYVVCAAL